MTMQPGAPEFALNGNERQQPFDPNQASRDRLGRIQGSLPDERLLAEAETKYRDAMARQPQTTFETVALTMKNSAAAAFLSPLERLGQAMDDPKAPKTILNTLKNVLGFFFAFKGTVRDMERRAESMGPAEKAALMQGGAEMLASFAGACRNEGVNIQPSSFREDFRNLGRLIIAARMESPSVFAQRFKEAAATLKAQGRTTASFAEFLAARR